MVVCIQPLIHETTSCTCYYTIGLFFSSVISLKGTHSQWCILRVCGFLIIDLVSGELHHKQLIVLIEIMDIVVLSSIYRLYPSLQTLLNYMTSNYVVSHSVRYSAIVPLLSFVISFVLIVDRV